MFTNDLDHARKWLKEAWRASPAHPQLPQLVHWGLSLGLYEEVEDWLADYTNELPILYQQKIHYRIARIKGKANPYLTLVTEKRMEKVANEFKSRSSKDSSSIRININGGIGDHLQFFSLLFWWNSLTAKSVHVEISQGRAEQFGELLQYLPFVEWTIISNESDDPVSCYTSLDFELITSYMYSRLSYASWLIDSYSSGDTSKGFVFCWQSKGVDDLLSCFMRSVQFEDVCCFYKQLRDKYPKVVIIDITDWNLWEKFILKGMGIDLYSPFDKKLIDLITLISDFRVFTIDTALAHLCASMGKKATILLPLYPDERWYELAKPSCSYGSYLQLLKQSRFGCWKNELKFIADTI
ncbi:hypothetical protein [Prochlorococcus sp. MIT 1300]|uniref:hypothetical protein n=1 Tax=Prochlorococcus sp. MIT 1300 TaxID=3096218 RepID=UPI002A74BC9F|nr:hypothetical protein [Prochlorococcus sp. MIT 1300]